MDNNGNFFNLQNLPNEILIQIFKLAKNDKNLSLTCFKFYQLISKINENNFSLSVDYKYLINPSYNFNEFLNSSSTISLKIEEQCLNLSNFENKLEFFLQIYGHKIKKLIIGAEIKNFFTKFLPLMPNLDELELRTSFTIENDEIKNFPINLKKLKLCWFIEYKNLEVFNFDELEIKTSHLSNPMDILNFIKKNKSLKTLKIQDFYINFNLKKALKDMKLETLIIDYNGQKMAKNYLKNQKDIKNLSLSKISPKNLITICGNMKNLVELHFSLIRNTPEKILLKLSNLKNLKFLTINSGLDAKKFEALSKVKIENLEILGINISFKMSIENIENLSRNFQNLKALSLNFNIINSLEIISKVFEKFNKLESFAMKIFNHFEDFQFDKNLEENFYKESYKNENLKVLDFYPKNFQYEKLIQKFIRDFPNLEILDLGQEIEEFLELILIGFKKLKIIENLKINEKMLKSFLNYGRNLEEFKIDINLLQNPNEILKNHSIIMNSSRYYPYRTLCKMMKEKEMKIDLPFSVFSHWQSIQTVTESTKDLKNITINSISDEIQTYNDKMIIDLLKSIGKNVTNLTLNRYSTQKQLINYLKFLPNCKIIIFVRFYDFLKTFEILNAENSNIESVYVDLYLNNNFECSISKLNYFEKFIKNTENFKFVVRKTFDTEIENEKFLKSIDSFLAKQPQLRKKNEKWNESHHEFIYEFTTDSFNYKML
ncbi:hypothetical protein PVAND_016650 [Polypedilum vanderplanki]|uniref:F-box domain-containing protein n=1 Tax=Polypedilum vanderplanki TaxID=319348 RepID=A0A9J6BGT0_POLVA|nr:hypothetical protein PVAND_016650 [Polypedilum vanderplanki]